MTAALLIGSLVVVAIAYGWYAAIVARRNRVGEALGSIDVFLTQRHDMIPNLLAIAKRFMAHESDLLNEITRLRSDGSRRVGTTDPANLPEKFADEERLGQDVRRLLAVAENYPELTSQAPMIEAQRGITEAETNIAAARRCYNAAVGDLRNATQIFPGPVLARLAGVGTLPPFYESQPEQRAPVDAASLL